jgi:hypothetical protein
MLYYFLNRADAEKALKTQVFLIILQKKALYYFRWNLFFAPPQTHRNFRATGRLVDDQELRHFLHFVILRADRKSAAMHVDKPRGGSGGQWS